MRSGGVGMSKSYTIYWRNPKTRQFEALPGVWVIAQDGKPELVSGLYQRSHGTLVK